MPSAMVYNFEGQVVGSQELPASVFEVPVKAGVLHLAVVAQRANARLPLAHTKTRGEVRGGGRKPWRQKGTGRARHGSIRSPIWIGGGVTFGPRPDRNFQRKINRKVKRQALLGSLTAKATSDSIRLVDELAALQGKTKQAFRLLQNLKLRPPRSAGGKPPRKAGGRPTPVAPAVRSQAVAAATRLARASAPPSRRPPSVLVVLPSHDQTARAFRNLPRVGVIAADSLNVADVLGHQILLLPLSGLAQVVQVYGRKDSTSAAAATKLRQAGGAADPRLQPAN